MAKKTVDEWTSVPQDEPEKDQGDPLTKQLKLPGKNQTDAPRKLQGDPVVPAKKKKAS